MFVWPPFVFIGIGIMRFWYQYNFYNLHFSVDYGFATVATNMVRVAVIAILLLLSWRVEFSARVRTALVWVSMALMTVSSGLNYLELLTGSHTFMLLRYIIGGVGLVWGAGMWMDFFSRLKPSRAFPCLALGLALSCLLSLLGGFLSPFVMGLANLFIPACSLIAYLSAMRRLDIEDRTHAPEPQRDFRYSTVLRGDVVKIGIALFVYAFAMGMALGYPDGRLRELSQTVRTIHQLLIIVLLVWLIWWVSACGHRFTFNGVWYFENALIIASILLLASEATGADELSAFLIVNAETCFFSFTFFVCYAIGCRSRRSGIWILGVIYGGTLFFMSVGRIANLVLWPLFLSGTPQLLMMSAAVVCEMTLVLRPDILHGAPLFDKVSAGRDSHAAVAAAGDMASTMVVDATSAAASDAVGIASGATASGMTHATASEMTHAAASGMTHAVASEMTHAAASEMVRDAANAAARDTASTSTTLPAGAESVGTMPDEIIEEQVVDLRTRQLAALQNAYHLSDTEVQIVHLISHGRSRSYIASALGYSPNTIRNYTRDLYAKVDVHSKQELIDLVDQVIDPSMPDALR